MKYGIRECCDVVFRAKSTQTLGNKTFFKDEPVIYFDSLKTSSLEGQATTVYAQGGRGNARLVAWDGERTLTFTMEDSLISPEGIAILTGAGLIDASKEKMYVHTTKEIVLEGTEFTVASQKIQPVASTGGVELGVTPVTEKGFGYYMMLKDPNGNIISEPFSSLSTSTTGKLKLEGTKITLEAASNEIPELKDVTTLANYSVFVDFYVEESRSGAVMVDITPDKFAGSYYIEASTLFRDQATGRDDAAEFIIPNGKIQSNFTFTMAGSGDPSTFTFTVDALKGRIKGTDHDTLAAIQIIPTVSNDDKGRDATDHVEE